MSQATDGFTAAVTQLDADVTKLVAENGPAAVSAAVDAFATTATAQVQAVDAKVTAGLTPAS